MTITHKPTPTRTRLRTLLSSPWAFRSLCVVIAIPLVLWVFAPVMLLAGSI